VGAEAKFAVAAPALAAVAGRSTETASTETYFFTAIASKSTGFFPLTPRLSDKYGDHDRKPESERVYEATP